MTTQPIPKGTIADIANFEGGTQPPRATFSFSPSEDRIRLIQIRDYKSDEFKTYIPKALARNSCSADDIMIGRYGPPVFQILRGLEGSFNVALIKVHPKPGVNREYLYQILKQKSLFELIDGLSQRSSGQTGVDMAALRSFPIFLPTDDEQKAIAEVLSDADALIEGLERLIAKKRLIKQGAMQDLLTAKRRLPGFSGEWVERKLGAFGKCLRGVSYDGKTDLKETDTPSTVRLLRSNNVQGGQVNFEDMQYVNSRRVSSHQYLRDGDALICMANGSRALVGKAATFRSPDELMYTFGAFMGAFRTFPETCSARFLAHILNSDRYRFLLNVILSGSAINNLAPSQVEGFEFLVPCDDQEQEAIAGVLDDMDAEIQALETRLEKARQLKEGMMQNLLTGRIRLV